MKIILRNEVDESIWNILTETFKTLREWIGTQKIKFRKMKKRRSRYVAQNNEILSTNLTQKKM